MPALSENFPEKLVGSCILYKILLDDFIDILSTYFNSGLEILFLFINFNVA